MIAVLGMYPFAHVRDDHDALWDAVRARIDDAPAALDHETDLHASWLRDDLFLGQTCGWPLVTKLAGHVDVVGRFDVAVPFAVDGHYRTVLVAAKPLAVDEWRRDPATVCAMNSTDSLSGWVSLQWAWGGVPGEVLATGGHAASLRAVAEGRAQLASIDAVSFEHLCLADPAVAGRVHVVGHGPLVPTLPLITAPGSPDRVDALRRALADVVADPALRPVLGRLRIRGFVPCGPEPYAGLEALLPAR